MERENSALLINEPPLQVLPTLAMLIGLNQAIALQQLKYWLNQKDKKHRPFEREGRRWVHNTYDEWQSDNFPFWSVSTIKRIFQDLEDKQIVISRQFDLSTGDPRKYYSIDYVRLNKLLAPSAQSDLNPSAQSDLNPSAQSDLDHQANLVSTSAQSDLNLRPDWSEQYEAETTAETTAETSAAAPFEPDYSESDKETEAVDAIAEKLKSLHGISDKAGFRITEQFQSLAMQLNQVEATPDDIQAFWEFRKVKPQLHRFAADFITWRAGQIRHSNGRHSTDSASVIARLERDQQRRNANREKLGLPRI